MFLVRILKFFIIPLLKKVFIDVKFKSLITVDVVTFVFFKVLFPYELKRKLPFS